MGMAQRLYTKEISAHGFSSTVQLFFSNQLTQGEALTRMNNSRTRDVPELDTAEQNQILAMKAEYDSKPNHAQRAWYLSQVFACAVSLNLQVDSLANVKAQTLATLGFTEP